SPGCINCDGTRETRRVRNSGAAAGDGALVPDNTLPERCWYGHRSGYRRCSSFAIAFIGEKEVRPIVFDRSAGIATKDISQEWWAWGPLVTDLGRSGQDLHIIRPVTSRRVAKPIVRSCNGVAVIFVKQTMPIIRAGLRHQRNLSTRRSALIGIGVRGRN